MEKCIGCELCAGVCPAKCIYVRGADNDPDNPTSPGERFGFVYEINYLRCIHCDLCVEACPTEAITESKLFEFSFTNRQDAIYTKAELVVDDDGKPKRMPWEDWRDGEDEITAGGCAPRRRRVTPRSRASSDGAASSATASAPRARQRASHHLAARGQRDGGEARTAANGDGRVRARVGDGARRGDRRDRASNPVHAALSLVLTLFGVAVHFVALGAHFLAAVQVIVYAGAIVVLFLFVIMLLGVDRADDLSIEPFPIQRPLAAVVGIGSPGWSSPPSCRARATRSARDAARLVRRLRNIRQLAAQPVPGPGVRVRVHVDPADRRRRRHRR